MLDFPEDDLIQDLVELFFQHVNTYFPVLHRQTFQRSIGEGLHSTHHEFACLVLAVCATASRYSNDPRVFSDSSTEDLLHTAGWKWYKQVRRMNETSLNPPSVYKLQMYSVRYPFFYSPRDLHAKRFSDSSPVRFRNRVTRWMLGLTRSWYPLCTIRRRPQEKARGCTDDCGSRNLETGLLGTDSHRYHRERDYGKTTSHNHERVSNLSFVIERH